jgi:tetratricopeptide (TPR) repeat protein
MKKNPVTSIASKSKLTHSKFAGILAVFGCGAVLAQMPGGMQGGGMPGGGGRPSMNQPGGDSMSAPRVDKPDVAAQKAYRAAEKSLAKAREHDDLALKAPNADKKTGELEKARDSYYRALDLFTEALSGNAEMFEAWNGAGEVHLRLGAYGESVDDYDHALKFRPDYPDATLHRAEAYLQLDRLDEAESAYMELFNHDRPRADRLLQDMQQWLAAHRAEPKGMRQTTIDAFDTWLKDRAKAAAAS